jgi:hypothetical protein
MTWDLGDKNPPESTLEVDVYDNTSAATGVQSFVSQTNNNFYNCQATTVQIRDSNDADPPINYSWDIAGCFKIKTAPWSPPEGDGEFTTGQPFLLLEAPNITTNGAMINRWYIIYWTLGNNAGDSYITSTELNTSMLPGWADANNVYGFTTFWKGDEDDAHWLNNPDAPDSATAWADVIRGCWFSAEYPTTDGILPGQLTLTPHDPDPTPTPTPVTGAGLGEITFNGEQIAQLIPGFND